jgi:hypothetical protein
MASAGETGIGERGARNPRLAGGIGLSVHVGPLIDTLSRCRAKISSAH